MLAHLECESALAAQAQAGDEAAVGKLYRQNRRNSSNERVELGKLKGNKGVQNYEGPSGTDLSRFQTVSISSERFNANFDVAPLEQF
jgi:hypothetical protein